MHHKPYTEFSESTASLLRARRETQSSNCYAEWTAIPFIVLVISVFYTGNVFAAGNYHHIEMFADKPFPEYEYLAYRMVRHEV